MQVTKNDLAKKAAFFQEKSENLETEVERLQHIIYLLKKDKFGSKGERFDEIADQMIFNEIEIEASKAPEETETIEYVVKKGRKKKKPIPDNVPREERIIDIPDDEKVCPHDGTPLKCIGEVVTEKLKTVPAQTTVIVEKRLKYTCPCCDEHMNEAKSSSILPGTIATPEILAFIIFSKFFQGLPLYRLEEMYKLQGIDLKRSTMARWMIQVSVKLRPLWNILEDMMLASGYVTIDASSMQVLKEKGRRAQTKSFMWSRGSPELGIVLFDYNISGGGAIAKSLMEGFEGAHATSVLYSLAFTIKLNGKNPFEVLAEIFKRLPGASTGEDYQALVDMMLSPPNTSCHKKEGALIQ